MNTRTKAHYDDSRWQIPESWTWIRLEDITHSIKPGFPSGKHNREMKGVPHIRPMNINTKGEIDMSDVKFVQPELYDALMKGDVLFNNTNSPDLLGKTACIKQDTNWAYSNHMTRIRFDTALISPEWISYALHNLFFRGFFKMNCRHHVNQASINSTYLATRVDIPLAPHQEQKRIVSKIEELFTKLDAGIEALKKAKGQLSLCRSSTLEHAFSGTLTEKWRRGSTEKTQVLSHVGKMDDKSESLPDNWALVRLGNVCKTMTGGTPSRKIARYFNGTIPWLKSGELENNMHINSAEEHITQNALESSSARIIPKGTLLIALYGATVGKLGILEFDAAINQAICAIITPEGIESHYLFWFLMRHRNVLLSIRKGGAQPNISQGILSEIEFPLAPKPEQKAIVEEIERRFSTYENVETSIKQDILKARGLRQAILAAAYSGKILFQDPNEKSATILLERIRKEIVISGRLTKKKSHIKQENTRQRRLD